MANIPTSEGAPLVLTTSIFPDWARGVRQTWRFTGSTSVAHSGAEQRLSRSPRPRRSMELTVAGLNAARNRAIFEILENRGGGILLVPWFPEGLRLSIPMTSAGSAQIEVSPPSDWARAGDLLLIGDELRELSGITDRVLSLESGGGSFELWKTGTWVYPMRRAVLDKPEQSLNLVRFDAASQTLRFTQSD